jgi:coenzyme F420-reducing hydrogenase delta subunit/Pyruvate/2-oxoacid:ferredoxin oxidoreductase delta subunit
LKVTLLSGKTLLIGSGECARRIAEAILTRDPDLIIATAGESLGWSTSSTAKNRAGEWGQVYTNTKIHSCKGTVGDFKVTLECDGAKRIAAVDQIIIAENEQRIPDFSSYGLTRTDKVVALSQLEKQLDQNAKTDSLLAGIKTVVFLVGIATESNPLVFERIMQSCLRLQSEYKLKIYILTGNLKVAANGLEKMYRDTRDAGVIYIKFTQTRPELIQLADGSVTIEFIDEVTGNQLKLPADLTIVDEKINPSDYAVDLARIFELEEDLNGFAQGDNVHRLTVLTNRKGILVAGPTRSVQSLAEQVTDADNAVLSVREIERQPADQTGGKARIDNGKCVRCLTCFRLCPYRAIQVDTRVTISAAACEGCGICLAECPRGAISFDDEKTNIVSAVPAAGNTRQAAESFVPSMIAFCCSRSAARAAELAACMGKTLPHGFQIVEVPCGGSVSLSHILTAFNNKADGVMILTCHEGNCHSGLGPRVAQQRVAQIAENFSAIGLEGGRLVKQTLASNMGVEFAKTVIEFEKQLLVMGPIRLKSGEK